MMEEGGYLEHPPSSVLTRNALSPLFPLNPSLFNPLTLTLFLHLQWAQFCFPGWF
jgi:hypothetical protein